MRVNKISTKQNFGVLPPNGFLGKMKKRYTDMYLQLNEYSTPAYTKHVTDMTKALLAIDELSPNYIVDIFTPKTKKPLNYIPVILYAHPRNQKKNTIMLNLVDINYPFLKYKDLCKIASNVKFIEDSNIK